MIRAFLALPLPDPVLSALRVQQFLLPLPRQVDPDSFHLTLVFLGEVQDHLLEAAHDHFIATRIPPFDIALQGLGLFGGAKPHAAWAGVAPSEPLTRLAAKLDHAARSAGIRTEARRFAPHVTLGRFPTPSPDDVTRLERAIAQGMGFTTDPWRVDHFDLYDSRQTTKGPRYDLLYRYIL
jgi:2'-5' RNA ligase